MFLLEGVQIFAGRVIESPLVWRLSLCQESQWLRFYLRGVAETAEGAVVTARHLVDLFQADRAQIQKTSGRQAGSLLRVHETLKQRPLCTLADATKRSGLSFPAAGSAMELLVQSGVAKEPTGKKRYRVFVYDKYLATLSEGTEPL